MHSHGTSNNDFKNVCHQERVQPFSQMKHSRKQILAQITEGLNEYVREMNAHLQKHNGITSPFFAYVWL